MIISQCTDKGAKVGDTEVGAHVECKQGGCHEEKHSGEG